MRIHKLIFSLLEKFNLALTIISTGGFINDNLTIFAEAANTVQNNFFCMDDYLESNQTMDSAITKTQALVNMFPKSRFKLTTFSVVIHFEVAPT